MVPLTSGPISEFFLQNLEHLHLTQPSNKHRINNYHRYVDDILLILDSNQTNIQNILDDFNAIHPNLKFTAETETNNSINYLDVTIRKTPQNWKFSIYRNPHSLTPSSHIPQTIQPYINMLQ